MSDRPRPTNTFKSFDHQVFPATPGSAWQAQCQAMRTKGVKCSEPSAYVARYYYVTGRKGRVSSSDRWVCSHHAEMYALRHGITIQSVAPGPGSTDAAKLGGGQ